MTPARSRLRRESAATPASVSGTPGMTTPPFSKHHPGLLKCLTFYSTQSGLSRGAGTLSKPLPNLCFFSYKQKDGSCRSTGTVMFVTPIGAQIGRQASQPPLLLSVFWSLGENANSKSRKSSKGKTKLLNEPSAFGLPAPLLFFPPSGH